MDDRAQIAPPVKAPAILRFTVPGTLPGLNAYTRDNRGNKYRGNRTKREAEACITPFLPRPIANLRYPVTVSVVWHEPNRRRDVDNITFGVKFLLDAMVRRGVLDGDGQRFVRRIRHEVACDPSAPRIEVTVEGEQS